MNDGATENNVAETCAAIRNATYKLICVNEADVIHFEDTKAKVLQAFEDSFPKKSCFEK